MRSVARKKVYHFYKMFCSLIFRSHLLSLATSSKLVSGSRVVTVHADLRTGIPPLLLEFLLIPVKLVPGNTTDEAEACGKYTRLKSRSRFKARLT